MTRLRWDERPFYEEGLDRGVLYSNGVGVVWNGLVSVVEDDTGILDTTQYFDGVRHLISQSVGDFKATITAYTYPDEFSEYDGYSESVVDKRFGLSYRTGTKLHIVYNALAKLSTRSWVSLKGSADLSSFMWDISATPRSIPNSKPGSHLVIDLSASVEITEEVEDLLYGTNSSAPRLPSPLELINIFEAHTTLRIFYFSNDIWVAIGPDDMLQINLDGSFSISAPTAFFLDGGKFIVDSY